VVKNNTNLICIIAAGAVLTGCASMYDRVPDSENIDVRAGVLFLKKNGWDRCKNQPIEKTRDQFREAAVLKCGDDEVCRDETYAKLADGYYSLRKIANGAGDGSAVGLIPLAMGSSTTAWGNATVAGMVLGMLSSGRENSLKECTMHHSDIWGESGEPVGLACWPWKAGKNLDPKGSYTDEERVVHLLNGDFDHSRFKHGDPVVNTRKDGPMIKRRCALMTPEEFDFVQKRTGIQVTKGKKREN